MSLTKETAIESFDFKPRAFAIQVLYVTRVYDDGVLIATKNRREVLTPTSDFSHLPEEYQAVIPTAFTPELTAAYETMVQEENTEV